MLVLTFEHIGTAQLKKYLQCEIELDSKLRVQNNIHFNLTPVAPSGFSCKCHIFVPLCNSIICQSFVLKSSSNLQKTWRVFQFTIKKFTSFVFLQVTSSVGQVQAFLAKVLLGFGPQLQEGIVLLKFLVETRLKSKSF